jgi:hypothetical protein
MEEMMAGLYEYERDGDVVGVEDGDGDCDCDGEEREKRMFIVVGRKRNVGLSRGLVNIHRREGGMEGHAIGSQG